MSSTSKPSPQTAAQTTAQSATQNGAQPEARISDLDDEIKRLREQQKPLSRRIGQAKANGEPAEQLLAEMRDLSARIKRQSAERKALSAERTVLKPAETIDSPADNSPSRPAYFQQGFAAPNGTGSATDPSSNYSAEDFLPEGVELCTNKVAWNDYVHRHPAATSYHRYDILDLIRKQHGLSVYPLVARGDGSDADAICGVLPIVHMKSALFGSFLVSLPYLNYGGVLATDEATGAKLMDASRALAEHLGCSHTEIRETCKREAWFFRDHKASMTRALPASDEIFDKEIGAKLRSQCRKAAAHGAEFQTGGKELVADFYTVFSTNMRDLGTPIYHASFFSALLDALGDDAFVALVYINGKPVAAGFLIAHGKTLEIPWASCLRRANRYDANMFLYRNILAEAIRRQYSFFDFGRSTIDGPTYRFKKQWGAVPQTLYWHYWLSNPDDPPGLNPDNPKFRLIIAIWQRLPVALTRIIGPLVAKHLP